MLLFERYFDPNLSPRAIGSSRHLEPASEAVDKSLFVPELGLESGGVECLTVAWVNADQTILWLPDKVVPCAGCIFAAYALVETIAKNSCLLHVRVVGRA